MKYLLPILSLMHLSLVSQINLNDTNSYLKETDILDYNAPEIQTLIHEKKWLEMDTITRIKSIYNFVRDDIQFGYNLADNISATEVLKDGYGQCNTKATLLMALLRATGVPNRIHGFTIDKALQKGAISGIGYLLSPNNILHSWVEINVSAEWHFLEGVILDKAYLSQLQLKYKDCKTTFCGYGAYTHDFQDPAIEWNLNHTYIQEKGINQDFGLFATPDEFYTKHKQDIGPLKTLIFQKVIRKKMNKNVSKIRSGH